MTGLGRPALGAELPDAAGIPHWKLTGQTWVIAAVTYSRDENGTHAALTLMPPQAYEPEPAILQGYDGQVSEGLVVTSAGQVPGSGLSGAAQAAVLNNSGGAR